MRYVLIGVKFLKYDISVICNKLFLYKFFRDSVIELVLLSQFRLDLVKVLLHFSFFRFEFSFCNLLFFFVKKREVYLVCYLFLSFFRKLVLKFVRNSFVLKLNEGYKNSSVFEFIQMKGLVKFEGVSSLYNLTVLYDDIVSLLNRYTNGHDIFHFFLDYEVKFLFGLLFSRSFGMFCLEPYVWDSEKNIFLSGSLSRLFNVSTSIDRMDRYEKELDGYYLLALLHIEGVLWYFSVEGQLDFTYIFFEDVVDYLDLFEKRLTNKLKVIFKNGLFFCDFRDFLLNLWFDGIILYSWSNNFLNCNLMYNICCNYNKHYFCDIFGTLTVKNFLGLEMIMGFLIGFEWDKSKVFNRGNYKYYYIKRRV